MNGTHRWHPRMLTPAIDILLHAVTAAILRRGMSRRTLRSYLGWLKRYIAFHSGAHPGRLHGDAVNQFMAFLATELRLSPASRNQALAALKFVHVHVLPENIVAIDSFIRAREPHRLPVVMTQSEVAAVLAEMTGVPKLVAMLLYGGGLRLNECLSLRIKDLDFESDSIFVRRAKGNRDRITLLPQDHSTRPPTPPHQSRQPPQTRQPN